MQEYFKKINMIKYIKSVCEKMKYELKQLNMNMGKSEYEMYQDIPLKESGSTNLCNGLPYVVFKTYFETQIARKY